MRPRRARFLAHPHRPLRWAHEGMRGTHGLAWELQMQAAGQEGCGWRMAGAANKHGVHGLSRVQSTARRNGATGNMTTGETDNG